MVRILLTGGGSTGHVSVNLALIPLLKEKGWEIYYIGSKHGVERFLIEKIDGVTYIPISTGKFRRYFDVNNIKDPFKVVKGVFECYTILHNLKPDLVFSKGGFVAVPVVLGAWMNGIPVVSHESDITPGLANRMSIPFSTKICFTFPEAKKHLPKKKSIYISPIVREELKGGSKERGLDFCHFNGTKPVILIMGGSQGSQKINEAIRKNIEHLTKTYQIVHLCGKGKIDESIRCVGYKQFEYVEKELSDVLAMTELIISRAGANALFECLSLRIPMILIPLTKQSSRGDQILNAESFRKQGFCEVLEEDAVTNWKLLKLIKKTYDNRKFYMRNMKEKCEGDGLVNLYELIEGQVMERK